MEAGKRNVTAAFEPLIEEFEQQYDTGELQAALADAGFDSQDNREFCHDRLDCPLLTAINPRRSSPFSQAALFRGRVLSDQAESPAETGVSIRNRNIVGSAAPRGGQFQVHPSHPAN